MTIGFHQKRITQYEPEPELSMRSKVFMFLGVFFSVLALVLSHWWAHYLFRAKTCDDFRSQAAAQRAYERNAEKYSRLDGDNNQKACESLP